MISDNDPPPASDAAIEARDIDTIGGDSTKEARDIDYKGRQGLHEGMERLARCIRTHWEELVSPPNSGKHHEDGGISVATRKSWVEGCNRYIRERGFENYFGGAITNDIQLEIYLREVDEEDSLPLLLNDGRRAYAMVLSGSVSKKSRGERGSELLEIVTVSIVLPSTRLPSGDKDKWAISENLGSSDGASAFADSNWSVHLHFPASVDHTALFVQLSEKVSHTLGQQDIPYSVEMDQLLSLLTDLVV